MYKLTPKDSKQKCKQFMILYVLATELWTLHPAYGCLGFSPSWWSHLELNLLMGRRILTLEADQVLDQIDRSG